MGVDGVFFPIELGTDSPLKGLNKLNKKLNDLVQPIDKLKKKASTALEPVSKPLQKGKRALKDFGKAGNAVMTKFARKSKHSISELDGKLNELTQTRNLSFNKREIRQLNREIEQTSKQLDKLRGKANRPSRKGKGGGVGSIAKGNLIASGVEAVADGARDALSDVVQLGLRSQALEDSILFSSKKGNEKKDAFALAKAKEAQRKYNELLSEYKDGGKQLEFLNKSTNLLGMNAMVAKEGYAQLSGAFMNTKLAGNGVNQIFLGVSSAARALNLDAETQKGAFLALSQMMSKGKVSAEELNGQLGERIPNALGIAAKAMGTTKGELFKMMEQGKLMSEDFLPKFAKELQNTFGEQALKQADRLPAKIALMNNAFERLKLQAFSAFEPFMKEGIEALTAIVDGIGNIKPILSQVFTIAKAGFSRLRTFFQPIFKSLLSIGETLMNSLMPVLNTLEPVLMGLASPVQELFASIDEVYGLLQPIIGEILNSFVSSATQGNILGRVVNTLSTVVRGVGHALFFVFRFLKPVFNGLARLAGGVVRSFLGVVSTIGDVIFGMIERIFKTLNKALGFIDKLGKKVGLGGLSFRLSMPNDLAKQAGISTNSDVAGSANSEVQFGMGSSTPTDGGVGGAATAATDRITSGGAKTTNINITVEKFQDSVNFYTTSVQGDFEDLEEQLKELFARVINGVQNSVE